MQVKFGIFYKLNLRKVRNTSHLFCRRPLVFYIHTFLFTFGLKYRKNDVYDAYFSEILILLIFGLGGSRGGGGACGFISCE